MNDQQLLKFYLKRGSPEAQQWNLSPACIAAQLASRKLLMRWVRPKSGLRVCNVGIGVGEWDDFLGYWLAGRGALTSIDYDREVTTVFEFRQGRERHPNRAKVVCQDVSTTDEPSQRFDLITVLGSTVRESGNESAFWAGCSRLLKSGGRLFSLMFRKQQSPRRFQSAIRGAGFQVLKSDGFHKGEFFVCLTAKINANVSSRGDR